MGCSASVPVVLPTDHNLNHGQYKKWTRGDVRFWVEHEVGIPYDKYKGSALGSLTGELLAGLDASGVDSLGLSTVHRAAFEKALEKIRGGVPGPESQHPKKIDAEGPNKIDGALDGAGDAIGLGDKAIDAAATGLGALEPLLKISPVVADSTKILVDYFIKVVDPVLKLANGIYFLKPLANALIMLLDTIRAARAAKKTVRRLLKTVVVAAEALVQAQEALRAEAEGAKTAVQGLYEVLCDARHFMEDFSGRNFIYRLFTASDDMAEIAGFESRIMRFINLLTSLVTSDTAIAVKAILTKVESMMPPLAPGEDQDDALRAKVQELGGPDALLSNTEAYRRFLSDNLAMPDQLILAELDLGCHRALEHSEVRQMWRCYIGSSAVWAPTQLFVDGLVAYLKNATFLGRKQPYTKTAELLLSDSAARDKISASVDLNLDGQVYVSECNLVFRPSEHTLEDLILAFLQQSAPSNLPLVDAAAYHPRPELEEELREAIGSKGSTATLVFGPPGVGKTELIIQVASELQKTERFPGGLWFTKAARWDGAGPIVRGIAETLCLEGVDDARSLAIELQRRVSRPVLLIIDDVSDALANDLDNVLHLLEVICVVSNLSVVVTCKSLPNAQQSRPRPSGYKAVEVKALLAAEVEAWLSTLDPQLVPLASQIARSQVQTARDLQLLILLFSQPGMQPLLASVAQSHSQLASSAPGAAATGPLAANGASAPSDPPRSNGSTAAASMVLDDEHDEPQGLHAQAASGLPQQQRRNEVVNDKKKAAGNSKGKTHPQSDAHAGQVPQGAAPAAPGPTPLDLASLSLVHSVSQLLQSVVLSLPADARAAAARLCVFPPGLPFDMEAGSTVVAAPKALLRTLQGYGLLFPSSSRLSGSEARKGETLEMPSPVRDVLAPELPAAIRPLAEHAYSSLYMARLEKGVEATELYGIAGKPELEKYQDHIAYLLSCWSSKVLPPNGPQGTAKALDLCQRLLRLSQHRPAAMSTALLSRAVVVLTEHLSSAKQPNAAAESQADGPVAFTLPGGVFMEIRRGDIAQLQVDAIVNAASESLEGGGGLDGAIHRAAGKELLEACKQIPPIDIRQPRIRCPCGEARMTMGFGLRAKYVIHAVSPVWSKADKAGRAAVLTKTFQSVLTITKRNGVQSIGLPGLGTGTRMFPAAEAAAVAMAALKSGVRGTGLRHVIITLAHDSTFNAYVAEATRLFQPAKADGAPKPGGFTFNVELAEDRAAAAEGGASGEKNGNGSASKPELETAPGGPVSGANSSRPAPGPRNPHRTVPVRINGLGAPAAALGDIDSAA